MSKLLLYGGIGLGIWWLLKQRAAVPAAVAASAANANISIQPYPYPLPPTPVDPITTSGSANGGSGSAIATEPAVSNPVGTSYAVPVGSAAIEPIYTIQPYPYPLPPPQPVELGPKPALSGFGRLGQYRYQRRSWAV